MSTQPVRTKFLDFDARRTPKTEHFCCKCQKDILGKYRMVHLVNGGAFVLHPGDENRYVADAGDVGAHPIGPDCARQIGLEWTHEPT